MPPTCLLVPLLPDFKTFRRLSLAAFITALVLYTSGRQLDYTGPKPFPEGAQFYKFDLPTSKGVSDSRWKNIMSIFESCLILMWKIWIFSSRWKIEVREQNRFRVLTIDRLISTPINYHAWNIFSNFVCFLECSNFKRKLSSWHPLLQLQTHTHCRLAG